MRTRDPARRRRPSRSAGNVPARLVVHHRNDRRRQMSPGFDRRWLTLAIVGAAFFMTVLDIAIVNVAIPSIQTDLHIQEKTVQWVITAYAITFGGFLLLGGRMSDLLGRRRIFIAG